jgi:hypothetical protein
MVQAFQDPPLCSSNVKLERREAKAGDHEQLILNGGRFKPALAERDNKQDNDWYPRIPTKNWFTNHLCPSKRLSRLWASWTNVLYNLTLLCLRELPTGKCLDKKDQ